MTDGLGPRIRKLRQQRGIKQEALAEMVGLSPNHLSAIERDMYTPKLETFINIVNALGCTADEALGGLINNNYPLRACLLSDRLASLPHEEQERIFALVDTMIATAKKM